MIVNYFQHPEQEKFALYLQQVWRETLDFPVFIKEYPWNIFRSCLEKKDFHVAGCYESAFCNDPLEFLQRFEEQESICNYPSWDHAHYQAINSSITVSKGIERDRLIHKAASILAHQTPYIPICTGSIFYSQHSQLCRSIFDVAGSVDFRFSTLGK